METPVQKDTQKKSKKDFIWTLVGVAALIVGLIMVKSIMHQFGLL